MMGSGKSSVGQALASLCEREFADTDKLLSSLLGRPIPSLFQVYGEEAFRAHETSVLRKQEPGKKVLATGGGIVLREENWTEFQRLGVSTFVDVDLEFLLERLERGIWRRTLLQGDDWQAKVEQMLEYRRPFYERADKTIKIGGQPIELVAQQIAELLQ